VGLLSDCTRSTQLVPVTRKVIRYESEAVNKGKIYITMNKQKRKNIQTMIYKTIHRKLIPQENKGKLRCSGRAKT